MISSKPVLVALLLITVTLIVPPAAATVTNSTGFSGDLVTGAPITVSYTKTTDDAGDGQQTGSVTLTWDTSDGCKGADLNLGSEAYDFSSPGSQEVTWTFRSPCAGTYDFTFNDAVTSGTELDDTDSVVVAAAFTLDWEAVISGTTNGNVGYDKVNALEVDDNGRVFFAYSLEHDGDSGTDAYVRAFDNGGSILWADRSACSSGTVCKIGTMGYDQANRLIAFECLGEPLSLLNMRAFNPATGTSETLTELALGSLGATVCPEHGIDAFSVGADDTAIFVGFTQEDRTSDNKLVRFDSEGTIVWETTHSHAMSVGVQSNSTHGAFFYKAGDSACSLSCIIGAFDVETGVVGAAADVTTTNSNLVRLHASPDSVNDYDTGIFRTNANVPVREDGQAAAGGWTGNEAAEGGGIFVGDKPFSFSTQARVGQIIDANDNALTCGQFSLEGSGRSYIGLSEEGTAIFPRLMVADGTALQGAGADCLSVVIDPAGGFYALFVDVAGSPIQQVVLQHYSSTDLTPLAAEPQANVPVAGSGIGGGGVITPTAGGDVGEGLLGFCSSLLGGSAAALFFCGLVLVIIVFLATAAAYAGVVMFGDNKGSGPWPAVSGSVGAFGMMIFNVFATIWEVWVGIVLIMITAAIVTVLVRKTVFGFAGGEN